MTMTMIILITAAALRDVLYGVEEASLVVVGARVLARIGILGLYGGGGFEISSSRKMSKFEMFGSRVFAFCLVMWGTCVDIMPCPKRGVCAKSV